jgi:hypothetical protein
MLWLENVNTTLLVSCIEGKNMFFLLEHKTTDMTFVYIEQLGTEIKDLLNLNIPRMIHNSPFLSLFPDLYSLVHTTGKDCIQLLRVLNI